LPGNQAGLGRHRTGSVILGGLGNAIHQDVA